MTFYAGGFLYNPDTMSVLLHLRDGNTIVNPNKWAFFGGTNEGAETPEETLRRELKEELDIEIALHELIPVCDYMNPERGTHRYIFYVVSRLAKSEMKLGEGADFDWIPLKKVFSYDLTERTRQDLQTFLSRI